MQSLRKLFVAMTLAAACAPYAAAAAEALPPLPPNLTAPPQPTAMPAFSLPAINGGTLQSSDMKGKVVVIRFWASW